MKQKFIIGICIFLLTIFSSVAVDYENGTIISYNCAGSCNVNYTLQNNISIDSLTVGDYYVTFDNDNISFIPETNSNLSIIIINWSSNYHKFNITGENKNVNFSVRVSNVNQVLNYNGTYLLSPNNITMTSGQTYFEYSTSFCGDLLITGTEECDSTNLNSLGCTDFEGYINSGTLSCSSGCLFDTSNCVRQEASDGIQSMITFTVFLPLLIIVFVMVIIVLIVINSQSGGRFLDVIAGEFTLDRFIFFIVVISMLVGLGIIVIFSLYSNGLS